jgi:hypothetical protein
VYGGMGHAHPFAQLLPAPIWPVMKVSGLKSAPYGPLLIYGGRKRARRGHGCTEPVSGGTLTLLHTPSSRSIWTLRGTYFDGPFAATSVR